MLISMLKYIKKT